MCGITGAVWTDPALAVPPELLDRMIAVLAHRGPDDAHSWQAPWERSLALDRGAGAALGFRRLSIIDVAGSRQPISNEDGSIQVVFNGEIYNYRKLRRRLEGAGHVLGTSGDGETIVHLYEDEELDFVRHIEGMFALALWDDRRQRLVLARDRLGKKPLLYAHQAGRLAFASELKSLLEMPDLPREVDPTALDAYLTYQYVPHPLSILKGVAKLPPAHVAVYEHDRLRLSCYWQPDFTDESNLGYRDAVAEVRRRLTAAVETRLQSDVPLGAFLSGGVDSSIVVGLMSRLTQEPVRTFSIGFPVPEYDETRYAREVSRQFGTLHFEERVEPDAIGILPKLVWHFDEPFSDSSAVPTYHVSRMTRQHVTVALTGDGGDELFAGYDRYAAVAIASRLDRLPASFRKFLARGQYSGLAAKGRQRSFFRRLARLAGALAQPPERRYLELVCIFSEARRIDLYREEFCEQLPDCDPADFLSRAFRKSAGRDPITRASLADLVTYLPCDLLNKVDIASMAHSLECRQPFLDQHVVELAASLPVHYKRRWLAGKRILLDAFADLLPRSVVRRKKMGFGVPLAHWFRHELSQFARDVLLDERTLSREYFRPESVRRTLQEHQSGQFDHGYRLWSLLVLELWMRQWLDGSSPAGTECRNQVEVPK